MYFQNPALYSASISCSLSSANISWPTGEFLLFAHGVDHRLIQSTGHPGLEAFRLIVYNTALGIHSIRSLNSPYTPAARRDRSLRTYQNAQMASHTLSRVQTGPAQGNGISRLTAFRFRRALCRRHLCHADGLMPAVRA